MGSNLEVDKTYSWPFFDGAWQGDILVIYLICEYVWYSCSIYYLWFEPKSTTPACVIFLFSILSVIQTQVSNVQEGNSNWCCFWCLSCLPMPNNYPQYIKFWIQMSPDIWLFFTFWSGHIGWLLFQVQSYSS